MDNTQTTLESASKTIEALQSEIARLKEQLAWFQKQVFGKRSEKIIPSCPMHPTLFDLDAIPKSEEAVRQIKAHTQKHSKSKESAKISFPEDLPIERVVIDVKEHEKICPVTGKQLVKIGEDITQKLAHKPGSFYIKEFIRFKYALKGTEQTIITAPLPESLFLRCKADESFLADVLVKKFGDHLPLYRQAEILSRQGIHVSRQVLSQWTVKCGLALKPLYERLKSTILNSKNLFIDEVPVDMLDPGKGKVHQAYMWVIAGGQESNPANRIYNFRTDRTHKNASSSRWHSKAQSANYRKKMFTGFFSRSFVRPRWV